MLLAPQLPPPVRTQSHDRRSTERRGRMSAMTREASETSRGRAAGNVPYGPDRSTLDAVQASFATTDRGTAAMATILRAFGVQRFLHDDLDKEPDWKPGFMAAALLSHPTTRQGSA